MSPRMRAPPFIRSLLLLLLLVSTAEARQPDEKTKIRSLVISEHPSEIIWSIYVSGQVATVLHFEEECDPARTRLLGWEGRFAPPLVGGRMVVLMPLRDLDEGDRFPLVVTLKDGSEFPLLVRAPYRDESGATDHQVNVFKNRESYNAVLSSLYDSLTRERELREENERYKKEENSVDHALATLLVNGQVDKTPFRVERAVVLKDEDMDVMVEIFSGPGKAAVVIHLTTTYNLEPWRFRDARLSADRTHATARAFALRSERAELVQGQSGRIAVVADKQAFESKEGLVDLVLEVFREDGLRQVLVNVDHSLIRK